jgi:hypothetical protein
MDFSCVIFVCNAAKIGPCWVVHCVKTGIRNEACQGCRSKSFLVLLLQHQ